MNPHHTRSAFVSRTSVVLTVCVTIVAALGLSAPRPGASGRERDRVVRLTRSGPQRLDAHDAVLHSHEETEPDTAFSSLVVGSPAVAADWLAVGGPDVSEPPSASLVLGADDRWEPVVDAPAGPPPRAALAVLPPGRAPPAL